MKPDCGITWRAALDTWIDWHIPANLLVDPESARHARLLSRFGFMGTIFGFFYTLFYLAIGHYWGAAIILGCTAGMVVTPSLMMWTKKTEMAGHFFASTLTLGFFSLSCIEGGVHGHALAWLVSVPLCALLLLGTRAAAIWLGIAFLAAALIVGCDLAGISMAKTYDPKWESVLSAAGYLGLVLFMSLLGLIFERGRAVAHAKMQTALKELSESNSQLVELNQEKTEFMGIAAHDLKNPLTAIMGFGELMQTIDDPSLLQQMAEQINIASERMHKLIKDLLDTNAIDQGLYASKVEPCDMTPIVRQIVDQNRLAAKKKHIEIQLGTSENLVARTDASATLQILDNLVSNAVKYSPSYSTIHVHTVPEKDHALILVRDEGPGISDDDQKKLFQKYCRLTARPTGGESSTGLGLSIAKRLAQALGGDILCRSAIGAGTTFILRLPLRALDPKRPLPGDPISEILREQATLAVSHRN